MNRMDLLRQIWSQGAGSPASTWWSCDERDAWDIDGGDDDDDGIRMPGIDLGVGCMIAWGVTGDCNETMSNVSRVKTNTIKEHYTQGSYEFWNCLKWNQHNVLTIPLTIIMRIIRPIPKWATKFIDGRAVSGFTSTHGSGLWFRYAMALKGNMRECHPSVVLALFMNQLLRLWHREPTSNRIWRWTLFLNSFLSVIARPVTWWRWSDRGIGPLAVA